jgi:hypothetical protein
MKTLGAVCIAAGLVASATAWGADDDAKKWLAGRWALAPAEPAAPAEAKAAPKPKPKTRPGAKKPAAKKAAEPIPKFVLEFTKDGRVRLDGEPSEAGDALRFLKPLAAVPMRFAPENRFVDVKYQLQGPDAVLVTADHFWLLSKLSGGGAIPPEKAKELEQEYRPRETLKVKVDARTLTLTADDGRSLTFRRYAGLPLDAAEAKRRGESVREGLNAFDDVFRRNGINVGAPKTAAPPGEKAPR